MISAAAIRAATGGRCPAHDDSAPSLSVSDSGGKILVHCFAGCSQAAVVEALRAQGLWPKAQSLATPQPERRRPSFDERRRQSGAMWKAQALWDRAAELQGTLSDDYLYRRRWLDVMPQPSAARHLRVLGGGWTIPAMIVAVRDARGSLSAVQTTALDSTGRKAAIKLVRQTTGVLGAGAVQLLEPKGDVLGLAEGVETALAAAELFRVPVWASLSAGRLGSIAIPEEIKTIRIFADHDEAGLKGAEVAARGHRAKGFRVIVEKPLHDGWDFADVLKAEKRGEAHAGA